MKTEFALNANDLCVGQWICELDDNGTTDYGLMMEVCEIDHDGNFVLLCDGDPETSQWISFPIYGVIQQ